MVTCRASNVLRISSVLARPKRQKMSAEDCRRNMCTNDSSNSVSARNTSDCGDFCGGGRIRLQRTTFVWLSVFLLCARSVVATSEDGATSPMPKSQAPDGQNPENISNTTKTTFRSTGNQLWDGFISECSAKPTISCIQKNVYAYLDERLRFDGDVNVTEGLRFRRNKLAHWKYTEEANDQRRDRENEVDGGDDVEVPRLSASPIEEVTDALYDKSVGFMMTHDVELRLPEMLFDGAVLKISPRALEGSGALVHLDLQTNNEINSNGEGRIFFKKIKKFIKNKILLGILAIIVVVKLIKLKLFVFLPLIMGVHNAKKLFLKLLLFVFPALSHIFKLCSWYHENYHHTKYHHHHHQINHIHHPTHGYPPAHQVEFHGGGPSASQYLHHDSSSWDYSSPGLGPEFIGADIHRNSFNPRPEDMNDIKAWGLGSASPDPTAQAGGNTAFTKAYYEDQRYVRATANTDPRVKFTTVQGPTINGPTPYVRNPNQVNPQVEKEALIRAAERQRQEQLRIAQHQQILRQQEEQKIALQHQLSHAQIKRVEDGDSPCSELSKLVSQAAENGGAPVYDAFYTPILQKVDKVFEGLGFHNEPCRERLICLMYKDPASYSPHSNLISNELSRDANELQKPAPGSNAAIRFFKYVQAARDGQDRKDCVQLYPLCAISAEKKSLN